MRVRLPKDITSDAISELRHNECVQEYRRLLEKSLLESKRQLDIACSKTTDTDVLKAFMNVQCVLDQLDLLEGKQEVTSNEQHR